MKQMSELDESIPLEEKQGLSYLKFAPLEKFGFLNHGFVLRKTDGTKINSTEIPDLVSKASGVPAEGFRVVIPKQIHQSEVLSFAETPAEKVTRPEGDALLTDQENLFLVIQVADCLPVFLVDPEKELVGLAHIGWRGAVSGMAGELVRNSFAAFGAKPSHLHLVLGPCIGKCCYKISDDLAVLFEDKYIDKRGTDNYLNLRYFVKDRFLKLGVKENNVFVCQECTFCSDQPYKSYRRDKEDAGRMIAFIGKTRGKSD